MNEPSVLDYVKALLDPRVKEKIQIPLTADPAQSVSNIQQPKLPQQSVGLQEEQGAALPETETKFPILLILAMLVGFVGQKLLEPPARSAMVGGFMLLIACVLFIASFIKKEIFSTKPEEETTTQKASTFNFYSFIGSIIFGAIAVVLFMGGKFNSLNLIIWFLSLGFFIHAFWVSTPGQWGWLPSFIESIKTNGLQIKIDRRIMLIIFAIAFALFFRFYQLQNVPSQPFSDHAEKLLDVYDVTQGNYWVFFTRNTGREFIQFYLTALLATVFNMGLTFMALKTGTVLIGLFALPFIYGIGKEFGGRKVGYLAFLLAASSYWLNTISRIGLRFPLYPAFTAPAMYFLIRGLKRQNRNDFILSGLFLGLGLHGYTPSRVAPFVILLGILVYLFHQKFSKVKTKAIFNFITLIMASVLVFIPLLGFTISNPDIVLFRSLTRVSSMEKPLNEPASTIFAKNNLMALTMFNYEDGETWVHSIPHRPALDIVMGVLFLFGLILVIARYAEHRGWLDLYMLLSIPVLLLPSTLSLAFPAENPSLNRTGAVAIVVMVFTAYAFVEAYNALSRINTKLAIAIIGLLLVLSFQQNYDLVFNQFSTQFTQGAWNTSDMGQVIKEFVAQGNDPEKAFVIPYPYWADTRLVGIQAGYPTKDYALQPDSVMQTAKIKGNKLFIFNMSDADTLNTLQNVFPNGVLDTFQSPIEGKSFYIFRVNS